MQRRGGVFLTASALVLWQLAAAVLVPVILLAGGATPLASESDGPACPVCASEAPGAACPMHVDPSDGATHDDACALTSADTTGVTLFNLFSSVSTVIRPIEICAPSAASSEILIPSGSPFGCAPVPQFPPPRA